MRTIMRVVWRVLLLGLIAATPGQTRMPPLEDLLRQFEQIAFRHEIGGMRRQGRLIKWTRPIRVAIRGPGASAYKNEVQRQLAQLSRLSGLRIALISWYDVTGRPDIEVNFVPLGRGRRVNPNGACVTNVVERNFVLRRAEIFITSSIPNLRRHCIVEEITQALGLTNDSTVLRNSIFNDWSHQLSLSPADELMVRTLYDRRMRPGMPLPQAMYFARIILTEILYGRPRGRRRPYRR